MTLGMMTHGIIAVLLSSLSLMLSVVYAECRKQAHYGVCDYAECHYSGYYAERHF
jgi:hypothetical protein